MEPTEAEEVVQTDKEHNLQVVAAVADSLEDPVEVGHIAVAEEDSLVVDRYLWVVVA